MEQSITGYKEEDQQKTIPRERGDLEYTYFKEILLTIFGIENS